MATKQEREPLSWPDRQSRSSAPERDATRQKDHVAGALRRIVDECATQSGTTVVDEPEPGQDEAEELKSDQLVIDAILEQGMNGSRHDALNRELIRYAVPVLRHLLATGKIVGQANRLNRPPDRPDTWRDFTDVDREEFARDMIAYGLPVFTKAVFKQQKWSPARGAALTTYFVNVCVMQYSRLNREWSNARSGALPVGLHVELNNHDAVTDPAVIVAIRDEMNRVLQQIPDMQTRRMLRLLAGGYKIEEAAQLTGLTKKAAEGKLARMRKKFKKQRENAVPDGTNAANRQQGRTVAQ